MAYRQTGQSEMDRTPKGVIGQLARANDYIEYAASLGVTLTVKQALAVVNGDMSSFTQPETAAVPAPTPARVSAPAARRPGRRGNGARAAAPAPATPARVAPASVPSASAKAKDPKAVARGNKAWDTRVEKLKAAGLPVPVRKAPRVLLAVTDDTTGMTRGQIAYNSRLKNIMARDGVSEAEARVIAMASTSQGRTNKATAARAAGAAAKTGTTKAASTRKASRRRRKTTGRGRRTAAGKANVA